MQYRVHRDSMLSPSFVALLLSLMWWYSMAAVLWVVLYAVAVLYVVAILYTVRGRKVMFRFLNAWNEAGAVVRSPR